MIDFLANFSALVRSLSNRFPNSNFSASVGIGSNAWDLLFPDLNKPKELAPFQEIKGPRHTAVATTGDLFFHIRANQMAICYELASILHEQLKEDTYPISETKGKVLDIGNELKILRANMPFSNPTEGEYGTFFIDRREHTC